MDRFPISRKYVEANWQPSLGEKFWLDHYREPPPGHLHAECRSGSATCLVHYDEINPHNSLVDATKHFVESDLGFAITVVALAACLAGVVCWLSNSSRQNKQGLWDS